MKPRILHIGMCVNPAPLNGLQRAFIKHSSAYAELNCGEQNINQKVTQLASEFRPDIIFLQIQQSGVIHEQTVVSLKQLGAWVVNFTGDVRTPIPEFYYELGKHVDYTLFSNMTDVEKMQQDGYRSAYLEIGIDETIYNDQGPIVPVKPIVFFGNNYGAEKFPLSRARIDMVNFMKQFHYENFGMYGNGWVNMDGNFNHSQPEEASAYRGAKIAINISHFCYKRYSSDRLLRILGTGTPICLAQWYPEIDTDWTDGTHLRVWRNLEELKSLCDYYLRPINENERREIARLGMMRCHELYTFDKMIENLINLWKNRA